jgi:hypothetical protein
MVNWIDLDKGKLNGEFFFKLLISEIPDLKNKINPIDDIGDHARMKTFSCYANSLPLPKQIDKLKECFSFIENRIESVISDFENA